MDLLPELGDRPRPWKRWVVPAVGGLLVCGVAAGVVGLLGTDAEGTAGQAAASVDASIAPTSTPRSTPRPTSRPVFTPACSLDLAGAYLELEQEWDALMAMPMNGREMRYALATMAYTGAAWAVQISETSCPRGSAGQQLLPGAGRAAGPGVRG